MRILIAMMMMILMLLLLLLLLLLMMMMMRLNYDNAGGVNFSPKPRMFSCFNSSTLFFQHSLGISYRGETGKRCVCKTQASKKKINTIKQNKQKHSLINGAVNESELSDPSSAWQAPHHPPRPPPQKMSAVCCSRSHLMMGDKEEEEEETGNMLHWVTRISVH